MNYCTTCGAKSGLKHARWCGVHGIDGRRRKFKPRVWSLASALMFAQANATGRAAGPLGEERSARGNVPGAARLCAWALRRAHGQGMVNA